jgi:hypothetical protein
VGAATVVLDRAALDALDALPTPVS